MGERERELTVAIIVVGKREGFNALSEPRVETDPLLCGATHRAGMSRTTWQGVADSRLCWLTSMKILMKAESATRRVSCFTPELAIFASTLACASSFDSHTALKALVSALPIGMSS